MVKKKISNRGKKDFHEFAKKVVKMESLKNQLNALNVKGFESEVKFIKAKMDDVEALSQVSKSIEELRKKIEKRNSSLILNQSAKRNLENIPKIDQNIRRLKNSLEEHMLSPKKRIDPGVGIIVDTKFDDFISQIKVSLSEKLAEENKKLKVEDELKMKSDLEKRKKFFSEQHSGLVKKYHNAYLQKVKNELQKQVDSQLNKKVEEKLNDLRERTIEETRKKVLKSMSDKNKKVLKLIVNQKERELDAETRKAVDSLKNKVKKDLEVSFRKDLNEKETALKKKLEKEYSEKFKRDLEISEAEMEKKKLKLEEHIMQQAKRMFN